MWMKMANKVITYALLATTLAFSGNVFSAGRLQVEKPFGGDKMELVKKSEPVKKAVEWSKDVSQLKEGDLVIARCTIFRDAKHEKTTAIFMVGKVYDGQSATLHSPGIGKYSVDADSPKDFEYIHLSGKKVSLKYEGEGSGGKALLSYDDVFLSPTKDKYGSYDRLPIKISDGVDSFVDQVELPNVKSITIKEEGENSKSSTTFYFNGGF